MEKSIIIGIIGTMILLLILFRFMKARAMLKGYRAELEQIIHDDNNKAKGRYEQ